MADKNFLPKAFAKVNKHQQPLLPNIFLLVLSLVFIVLQNSSDFMSAFFNLMSFGCACAYALTMITAIMIQHKHPNWVSENQVNGGEAAYAMSKAALVGLTKCLAVKYVQRNIRVNCSQLGYARTPMVEKMAVESNPENPEQAIQDIAVNVPMKRLAKSKEVGE